MWLYQVAHLLARDRSSEHMAVIAGILVKRAQRLRGFGVTLVMVVDCPTTSPAKEAERARRRTAKMAAVVAAEPYGDEVESINETAEDDAETGMSAEPPASAAVSMDVSTTATLGPLDVHGAFQSVPRSRLRFVPPSLQKWKCAHVGALLWAVQLWGVANVAAHVDRSDFRRTAYQAWWLGLDQRRALAHARATSRLVAAWELDFDRLGFGDVEHADGSSRICGQGMRRMRYSPDPPAPGRPPLHFEDCLPATRARMLEAFADSSYARASDGESGRRVGMCAHQFTNERGGTYLRLRDTPAERDRLFPLGTVMHGHTERAEARAAAAAARETGAGAKAARRAARRAEAAASSSQQSQSAVPD